MIRRLTINPKKNHWFSLTSTFRCTINVSEFFLSNITRAYLTLTCPSDRKRAGNSIGYIYLRFGTPYLPSNLLTSFSPYCTPSFSPCTTFQLVTNPLRERKSIKNLTWLFISFRSNDIYDYCIFRDRYICTKDIKHHISSSNFSFRAALLTFLRLLRNKQIPMMWWSREATWFVLLIVTFLCDRLSLDLPDSRVKV